MKIIQKKSANLISFFSNSQGAEEARKHKEEAIAAEKRAEKEMEAAHLRAENNVKIEQEAKRERDYAKAAIERARKEQELAREQGEEVSIFIVFILVMDSG
jgi:hypothetical protein